MSLPACQQRVLDRIENALKHREPRLASMFAMFTRLNTNEGIPRTERLDPLPWWALHRRRPLSRLGRPAALRALILLPVAAMVVVVAMVAGMSTSPPPCAPGGGAHGLLAGHDKVCLPSDGFRGSGHNR